MKTRYDHIYKDDKHGTYYLKFYYVDWEGNKQQKLKRGFATTQDARDYEKEFLAHLATNASITFGDLATSYLDDCKARKRETTYNNRKVIIEKHYLPTFKNKVISEITPLMIRQWQNKYISSDYKPTYIRVLNNNLSAIFNYAMKMFGLKNNPVRMNENIGKADANRCDYWTKEDFDKFIETLKTPTQWNHKKTELYNMLEVLFTTLFYSGLRIGEILALNVEDFGVGTSTLTITKTYRRLHQKTLLNKPKTAKSGRSVVLPRVVALMLKNYAMSLTEHTGRLFPMTEEHNIRRIFHNVSKRAGLKQIRLHDLRHSHVSMLIDMGCQPIVVAERMGHANIRTTLNIYAHCYKERVDEVATKLDNLLR